MRQSKYVVIQRGTLEVPLVFPDFETHSEMARGFKVVSAGFCNPPDSSDENWVCWGESVSLNVSSRKEDSVLLTRVLK